MRLLSWGGRARRRESGQLVRRLYFAALGGSSLVAFASLWRQIDGLVGSRGIAPARELLERARDRLGRRAAIRRFPTVLWLDASDRTLRALCAAGTALSVLPIVGVAARPVIALL